MGKNVFITGTGREMALGFNFVLRYLEQGDNVVATVRKPSEALENLKKKYPDNLHIIEIDIGDTKSVENAAKQTSEIFSSLDLLINNAVTVSPDFNEDLFDSDLDEIAHVIDVDAVGPLRVTKALLPLLKKSDMTALVVNISSEAGSIGECYRTNNTDYAMAKAALNMATMTMRNNFKDDDGLNVICVHPGWMRTNEGNAEAPNDPYESAEKMRLLFEEKRNDKGPEVFVTFEGDCYPW